MTTQLAIPFPTTTSSTLDDWRRWGTAGGLAARTLTARADTIRRLALDVDPLTATPDDLVTYLAGLDVSAASRATYRTHLRAFYAWLVATGRRLDNPAMTLPTPRAPRGVPRPFTPEDVAGLYAATSHRLAAQTRAYVILAAYAGLRLHEIAKVRGEDVRGGRLRVHGKGDRTHHIPMHPEVQALAAAMPAAGYWFPGADDGHVSRVSVGAAITRAIVRAGIDGTPHACRHFYGTEALRGARGNLRIAQQAMRHADIRSTAIYTQVTDDDVAAAIHAIPTGRPQLRLVR